MTRIGAATGGPPLALAVEPIIPTRLEALLATSNLLLVVDSYRIDMRFGPNMRIDAVIVEDVESWTRVKGLRVQVRDPDSRGRQEGTSFVDIDELTRLSRALTPWRNWRRNGRRTIGRRPSCP